MVPEELVGVDDLATLNPDGVVLDDLVVSEDLAVGDLDHLPTPISSPQLRLLLYQTPQHQKNPNLSHSCSDPRWVRSSHCLRL